MSERSRYEVLLAVVEARLDASEAARELGTTEERIHEWADLVSVGVAVQRRRARVAPKGLRRAAIALACGSALAVTLWGTSDVWAQTVCGGADSPLPAPLLTFCPNTPANALDVNANFRTLATLVASRTGAIDPGNLQSNAVSAGSVSTTGPVNASGDVNTAQYLTVSQGADFQCSGCGSPSTLRGASSWGRLTIQGRVLSGSNNIHLSPPAGANVIVDRSYRAAGGGTGGPAPGLDVEGNVVTHGRLVGALGRSSCNWRYAYMSNSTGGPDASDWASTSGAVATYGTDNRFHTATCGDGEYMAGFSCYATSYLDGNCRILCCTP
ncbi:MAG: hypothetical protein U0230_09780 [Polyangiales bacterium]